jgi:hypothetical protein
MVMPKPGNTLGLRHWRMDDVVLMKPSKWRKEIAIQPSTAALFYINPIKLIV